MEKDIVKESREVAEKIIRVQFRLTLAKYYLLWSTFPIVYYALYIFISQYPLLDYLIALSGYLYYNFKIFLNFSKTVERVSGVKRFEKKHLVTYLTLWLTPTAMIVVGWNFNQPYLTLAGYVTLGIVYSRFIYLYLIRVLHNFHYYDLLAMVTFLAFIVSVGICVVLGIWLTGIMWIPFTLAWIYASYASFMEVIESE